MSLEQAISDHASAIRELAAAIIKASDRVTTTHQVGSVSATVTKAADKPADTTKPSTAAAAIAEAKALAEADKAKKAQEAAAAKAGATGVSGAEQKTTEQPDAAPTIDYTTIRNKILELTKKPEGRDRCAALLKRFGVAKGPDLTPEQYEEFSGLMDRTLADEFDPRSDTEDEMA